MWHTGHDGGHQPRATPVINLFIAQESGNFSDLLPDITSPLTQGQSLSPARSPYLYCKGEGKISQTCAEDEAIDV